MSEKSVKSIDNVLSYWFDGIWNENYKTKWFPSGDIQTATDMEIYQQFYQTFQASLNHRLDFWKESGSKGCLALIILYDQFSRHIYRHLHVSSDAEERKIADSMALEIAESLISQPSWESSLSVSQHVFALMPFRHNATLSRLRDILSSIDTREQRELESLELITRFRKQTLRRLQHLEDRSKAQESTDILERYPFDADESNIYNEPLVLAIQDFLKRHIAKLNHSCYHSLGEHHPRSVSNSESIPVCISLSGGVDSMVIAKILGLLKSKLKFSTILAIHIDYANREESNREADYVEEWSTRMGFIFRKRIVNEVTRGITDRTIYEKVARDIRYGFYQQVLTENNCPAVIFGHHLGDVQENVISNIMRGSSPLQLSGMVEVGLTNGVIVWRPLLSYSKSNIYDFAHRYGVPYFKDTTPSWSTRGKLRKQLVPLLTDMYGEGFLQNLSNLAKESDDYLNLVQINVFQPFLSSVQHHPCGLKVNILTYRDQPLSFWKEMLKELMHSMSMSLIRDKAVSNFLERIVKPIENISGWMEMRKGYHTYLHSNGDLIIYRAGVLSEYASLLRGNIPNTTKSPTMSVRSMGTESSPTSSHPSDVIANWPLGIKLDLSNVISGTRHDYKQRIGVWEIEIHFVRTVMDAPDPKHPLFKKYCVTNVPELVISPFPSIADLLPGIFSYHINLPIEEGKNQNVLAILYDCMSHSVGSIASKPTSQSKLNEMIPLSLIKVDNRLKQGIPLLIPFYEPLQISTDSNQTILNPSSQLSTICPKQSTETETETEIETNFNSNISSVVSQISGFHLIRLKYHFISTA